LFLSSSAPKMQNLPCKLHSDVIEYDCAPLITIRSRWENAMNKSLAYTIIAILLIFCVEEVLTLEPVVKVLRSSEARGENLIQNGDFEILDKENFHSWAPYKNGYQVSQKAGRGNSTAAYCVNDGNGQSGISQEIKIDQEYPLPLLVRGWSKAQNVGGGKSSNYSVYVDITYQDGTPLWGQTGNFSTGTHDWEMQETLIIPAKPVKNLGS